MCVHVTVACVAGVCVCVSYLVCLTDTRIVYVLYTRHGHATKSLLLVHPWLSRLASVAHKHAHVHMHTHTHAYTPSGRDWEHAPQSFIPMISCPLMRQR